MFRYNIINFSAHKGSVLVPSEHGCRRKPAENQDRQQWGIDPGPRGK